MTTNQDTNTLSGNNETMLSKFAASFGGQIGVFVLAFIAQIVLARMLGPEGKGIYSMVVLIVNVTYHFSHGRLSSANSHFTGRYPEARSGIIGNNLVITIVWGGLVTITFLLFADTIISHFYPKLDLSLVKLTVLCLPSLLLLEYSNATVKGQNQILRYSILLALRDFAFLCFLAVPVFLGSLSVRYAVGSWAMVVIGMSLISAFVALSGNQFKLKIDFQVWKSMIRFSLQSHIANLTTFLKTRLDWLLIGFFINLTALGYYSNAVQIISLLAFFPTAIAQVIGPHISWRENQAGNVLTPVLCRITLFISVLIGILLVLFGEIAISFAFGKDFLPSYPIMVMLLPGGIALCLVKILAGDLGGRGLPKYAMKISFVVLIVNIISNMSLIPFFGVLGAAIAASTTHLITAVLFWIAFNRESHVRLVDTLIIQGNDFALISKVIKFKTKRS